MTRKLVLPEVVSITELFSEFMMQNASTGNGKYRDETVVLLGNRAFINQRRVNAEPPAIRFNNYGAKHGIKVRKDKSFFCYTISAGHWGTYTKVKPRLAEFLIGNYRGMTQVEIDNSIARKWHFEAVPQNDGTILILAGDSSYIGAEYIAQIDYARYVKECESLYSSDDLKQFSEDNAQEKLCKSFVDEKTHIVDIPGAIAAGIKIKYDPY